MYLHQKSFSKKHSGKQHTTKTIFRTSDYVSYPFDIVVMIHASLEIANVLSKHSFNLNHLNIDS